MHDYSYGYTVESLLQDAPYKGHNTNYLPIYKGQSLLSQPTMPMYFPPLKEDNLPTKDKMLGPKRVLYLEIPL